MLVKRESGESKDHYLTSGYQIIEIRPGINGWNCYQFHHTGYNYEEASIDSPKTFYKQVAAESIAQLINIIVKPDSNVNIDRFNINISELVRYTDSINTKIKPKQKAEFIKAVRTDTIIKKALNKVLHQLGFPDGLYNSITLTDNSGRSITIKANCFENRLYDLPWIGDGFKYYDPNITNFFESICGDSSYRVAEKQKLYFKIDEETYSEYFLTRFYWDDFKSEQSESFAILQNTLTPILFNIDEGRSIVNFQSALLPPYVEIHTSFKQGDTSIIRGISVMKIHC